MNDVEKKRAMWRKATDKYRTTDKGKASVRKTHYERVKRDRVKHNARCYLHKAVKDGRVVKPVNCSISNICKLRVEGHHNDYKKPLEVIWLCSSHHSKLHKGEL